MDPFVRRLIQRLHHPSQPLSRNRHFHTFDTPEGRKALKTSRRLRSLQRDLIACREEGGNPRVQSRIDDGLPRIEIRLERGGGQRFTLLHKDEFDLLKELPGVEAALGDTSDLP